MQDDYDKGDHVKEVFAYFGRAHYMANVFETGLALAVLQLDFLTEVMETFGRQGRKGFDRAKYEAEFDVFMNRQHAQTLGNLIKRTQGLADMDASLKDLIAEVKQRRDASLRRQARKESLPNKSVPLRLEKLSKRQSITPGRGRSLRHQA